MSVYLPDHPDDPREDGLMPAYVIQPHRSQYEVGATSYTHIYGCTWTTGANGVAAVSRKRPSPDDVHKLVKHSEEANPLSPGWSLDDLDLAMKREGVGFDVRTGKGWDALASMHDAGYYIAVQGDSDQFGNNTCSGAFNGDHCIGIHPEENEQGWWLIDDPICKTARYERPSVIRSYAQKLYAGIRFGVFTDRVPKADGLRLRYGARKTNPYPDRTRTSEPNVNVHRTPTTSQGSVIATIAKEGTLWISHQVTTGGDEFNGSSTWYGNRSGDRWIHSRRLVHEGGAT